MSRALSSYGEFVKWQIGLSTAALAGLWTKFDLLSVLSLQPFWWRVGIVGFVALLLFNIFSGVEYLRWLSGIPNWKERVKEIVAEMGPLNTLERTLKQNEKRASFEKNLCAADTMVPMWHGLTLGSFLAVCLFALVGLAAAAQWPLHTADQKAGTTPPPGAARYTVTYSAVHRTANGRTEAHTFLLDQWTGELWQMMCGPAGRVSFQHIHRLDFEGKYELPHDPGAAPAKPTN